MKILLVNPPLSLEARYGSKMKKFGAISEPMGLAYIASFLEKKQYRVRILDAAVLVQVSSHFIQIAFSEFRYTRDVRR